MTNNNEQGCIITFYFNAPRTLMWKMFTEPEHLMKWWGPNGFTTPVFTSDFRIGGTYRTCIQSPEGKEIWTGGLYREIVEPGWFTYAYSFADAQGNVVPASQYGLEGEWPLELLVTVMLQEHEGGTMLTLGHSGVPDGKPRQDTEIAWKESFEKLSHYLQQLLARSDEY